jgi:DNA replication and repair protein RecF
VQLRRLTLAHFRCYRSLELSLPAGPTVLVGGNAQGKSSLLEAVYVLATTRSPHAQADREMVSWAAADEPLAFSRVAGEVLRAGAHELIEVLQVRQAGGAAEDGFRKEVRLNGVTRRALDLVGRLNVVLFTPRDLDLVQGAPAERRRYLDVLLCQVDGAYCRALARYNRVLAQRNSLLRRLRERGGDRGELAFWDEQLVAEGVLVLERRHEAVLRLGELAAGLHRALSGDEVALEVAYRPRLVLAGGEVVVAAGGYGAALAASLTARREDELARGMTLSGPHRDDLVFRLGGVDMRPYGSRGQQRTVTLALKLAEVGRMHALTGEAPVLLLDDVLSELDGRRQAALLEEVAASEQTLLTTTEPGAAALARLGGALWLRVEAGTVRPV